MDIGALGGSGFDPKALREMMRGKNPGEQSPVGQPPVDQLTARGSLQIEQKNYTKTTLAGMQAQSTYANQQNAALGAAMAEVSASGSYAMRNLAGKRAERRMMEFMQRAVAEESQRNLRENRNAVEERAEQAVSGNGQTAAQLVSFQPEQTAAAPAPSHVAASASAQASISAPETAAAPAPVAPSLNVVV